MTTIQEITLIQAPIDQCFDLARSVEVHVLGNIHHGEQAVAAAGVTSGLVGWSDRVTWRAKHFGIWHSLTTEITQMDRPLFFQDIQAQGIFRRMTHDHLFRSIAPDQTEMKDVFSFSAPVPLLGLLAEKAFLGNYMRSLLQERNAAIKQVAESPDWRRYLP